MVQRPTGHWAANVDIRHTYAVAACLVAQAYIHCTHHGRRMVAGVRTASHHGLRTPQECCGRTLGDDAH